MKEDIKNLWVNALRSGVYKQGVLRLKDSDRYCCLGVLCEISGLSVWAQSLQIPSKVSYLNQGVGLPTAVMEWAQIKTSRVDLDEVRNLAYENDRGKTFAQIADIIEANWEKL